MRKNALSKNNKNLKSFYLIFLIWKCFLKGQSSELIFWVECKNLFVIGPVLGTPNIFDFGLIFEEIFVFENWLLGIVYYGESMLCVLFTTQSQNSLSHLLRGVVKNIIFFSKSITDLWKFAEGKIISLS